MRKKNKKSLSHPEFLVKTIFNFLRAHKFQLLYCVYPVLALFLVIQWFYDHTLFAAAEQGMQLYNPIRTFSVYGHTWINVGLGIATPFYIPRIPYYAFFAVLSWTGIASWFLQAAIYFVAITIALIFVAKFVGYITTNEEKLVPHAAAFLYLCNLFVLSQVLIRFLDSLLLIWALLPLFLYFWVKWIDTGRLRYLAGLLIASFLFASIFTLIAEILTIWIPAFIYLVFRLVISDTKKKIVLLGVIGLFSWVLISSWWLYPMAHLKNNTYAEVNDAKSNYTSVKEVSQFYSLSDVFLLRQKYYFSKEGPWSVLYQSEKYYVISATIFIFCLVGLLVSLKRRKNVFLVVLLVVGFFLVKGTNPPFGIEIYSFLFKYIPVTQVLRNPYEKLGVLFVLPYMVFASIGMIDVSKLFKKTNYIFVLIVLFISCYILVRPLFSKNLFPTSYRLNVPSYYQQANAYISSRSHNRIFHLPYFYDSGVTYDWRYTGEEPSEFLFSNESLAKMSHIPSIDNYYVTLGSYLAQKDFSKLLALINADTIVLHNEYVSDPKKTNLVQESHGYLQKWDNVSSKHSFDKLDVYSINTYKLPGFVYSATNVIAVNSVESGFNKVLDPSFDITNDVFLDTSDKANPKNLVFPSLQKVILNYAKVTNEKYIVHVQNAQKPFILVFSMSYNPNWQARTNKTVFIQHFKANGYANAWLIDKKGSYDVDIVFPVWPWD